ncbi:MAG: hypothetical protein Q8L08_08130 [Candidatus Nanopelagicaceae bacterium]|nr:hypothetical protein [Candidatus Nanopelagicaceae bacterium]
MSNAKSQIHRSSLASFKEYWGIHFLGLEFALATILTLIFGFWCKFANGSRIVTRLMGEQHSTIYGTFVTLDGALLGFMIAATAIILGFAPSEQFELLRNSAHYSTMWKTLKSTIRVLGMTTVIAIIALLVDRDNHSNLFFIVLWVGSTLLAGMRIGRSLWILENTIDILTSQKK